MRIGSAVQATLLAILAALAVALWTWQADATPLPAWTSTRAGWAAAWSGTYLAFVAAIAWQRRVRRPPDALRGRGWLVAHASQTGHADALARRTHALLHDAGVDADLRALGTLDAAALAGYSHALVVVATTGEGDAPDSAAAFARNVMARPAALGALQVGVLALGDREYDAFCAFGRRVDAWLHASGARPLFDRIDVDNGDAAALRHWQHHVGQLAGRTDLADWSTPAYRAWTLAARTHLNPGSAGGPVHQVQLAPPDAGALDWQAGDIAEIGPRHAPEAVGAWLRAQGVPGDAVVEREGAAISMRELAARSRLTDAGTGVPPQALADALEPLPHREYSIASIPADGTLDLVVRQVRHADGALGLGSGWLTRHAAPGACIDVRVRRNPGFHAPEDGRPVLLVGNGTGIAGLRALLKARASRGQRRNWLVFGERNTACDALFDDELDAWRAQGHLERLDRVFSRDGDGPRYVQDALRREAQTVRAWLAAGASVYVCGSLAGMAPGVDAALRAIAGDEAVDALLADGRYRRDVY